MAEVKRQVLCLERGLSGDLLESLYEFRSMKEEDVLLVTIGQRQRISADLPSLYIIAKLVRLLPPPLVRRWRGASLSKRDATVRTWPTTAP